MFVIWLNIFDKSCKNYIFDLFLDNNRVWNIKSSRLRIIKNGG